MAIIKVMFARHAKALLSYVVQERGPGDSVDANLCNWDHAHEDFEAIATMHNGRGEINAVHVVQSWSEEESRKLSADDFNGIGRRLVEEYFPGHAFLVVTHTGTGKTHNHIVVSPWHTETGKKIENKKAHLYRLRACSDRLCRARGLGVLEPTQHERDAKLPDNVMKMIRFNGKSHLFDLWQKADFARAWATSYDEYGAIMGLFGISVRVEDKTITYFYPGRERGKRGDKLGKKYDKEGLEKKFRENDGRFRAQPHLKDFIRGRIDHLVKNPGAQASVAKELGARSFGAYVSGKDYAAFTKRERSNVQQKLPHELEFKDGVLPLDEIRRARGGSILEYCRTNKIALDKSPDNTWSMPGRPYVKITDHEWINSKNKTRGSLIEFVAVHKDLSFLGAIAEINGNPRLLALESHMGERTEPFRSFYIPAPERADVPRSIGRISHLLRANGVKADLAEELYKSSRAQVGQRGLVHMFGENDPGGSLEFSENAAGQWTKTQRGKFSKPFFSHIGLGNKAVVYVDPFSFMVHRGDDLFGRAPGGQSVVCLMAPSHEPLDLFINHHPHITELEVATIGEKHHDKVAHDFAASLQGRYRDYGINVELVSHERAMERDLPGFSLSR